MTSRPTLDETEADLDAAVRVIVRIRSVMDHASVNRAMLSSRIMQVLDSTTIGTVSGERVISERNVEERLVVTDLCDLLAFERDERVKRRLRRAINFIEGYDCFPDLTPKEKT